MCSPVSAIPGFLSEDFCEKTSLCRVWAVVPGTAFGESGEGFVRISYFTLLHIIRGVTGVSAALLREIPEEPVVNRFIFLRIVAITIGKALFPALTRCFRGWRLIGRLAGHAGCR